jgi:hypothetical protein
MAERSKYGYRLAVAVAYWTKPGDNSLVHFESPFLRGLTMSEMVAASLEDVAASGAWTDAATSKYLNITSVTHSNNAVVCTLEGGAFGNDYRKRNTLTGEEGDPVRPDDALLWEATIILSFPPSDESYGVIASEVRGAQNHLASLLRKLGKSLKDRGSDLRLEVRHDVADQVAWDAVLKEETSYVERVEFVNQQPDVDDSSLSTSPDIKRVRVVYELVRNSATQEAASGLLHRMGRAIRTQDVAEAIGAQPIAWRHVDDTAVVVVQDGAKRTLQIESESPWFMYPLDQQVEPSSRDFIAATKPAAMETFCRLQVELPAQWWPSLPPESVSP